jgi:hypothetical protein
LDHPYSTLRSAVLLPPHFGDGIDNTTSFNPSKDMFNDNADPGNKAVLRALFWGQFFAFRLFLGLKRLHGSSTANRGPRTIAQSGA